MKKLKPINILGTDYMLYLYQDGEYNMLQEDARKKDARYEFKRDEDIKLDGYCDYQYKEIRIYIDKYQSKKYSEEVLRHEICHAFLYEMGYAYHNDEEFIEKLSRWVPNIVEFTEKGLKVLKDAKYNKE